MVGADLFCANTGRKWEVMRKERVREGAPEATGRGLGAAVPEAAAPLDLAA